MLLRLSPSFVSSATLASSTGAALSILSATTVIRPSTSIRGQ